MSTPSRVLLWSLCVCLGCSSLVLGSAPGFDPVGVQLGSFAAPTSTFLTCTTTGFAGYHCFNGTMTLCPSGRYCPTPAELHMSPAGYWAAQGSSRALECMPGSLCGEGTYKPAWFLLVILFLALFLILILVYFHVRRKSRHRVYVHPFESLEQCQSGSSQATDLDAMKPLLKMHIQHVEIQVKDEAATEENKSGMKKILHDVCGTIRGGRLTAIMGPSGSGKTTFLNALLNRIPLSAGSVTINHQYSAADICAMNLISFVPQDDTMLHVLTVRDLITHAALTRLPGAMTHEEKIRRVNRTMVLLGLTHIADTVVGNELERGVSGGEKKRVSIGMEMVADPAILFLDEPTSGLDSAASLQVCSSLRRIASRRTLVVSVIHAPRFEVFSEFDDLVLLARGGHLVYFGPIEGVRAFFEQIGFPVPNNCNPSDWYLDVISEAAFVEKWVAGGADAFRKEIAAKATAAATAAQITPADAEEQDSKIAMHHTPRMRATTVDGDDKVIPFDGPTRTPGPPSKMRLLHPNDPDHATGGGGGGYISLASLTGTSMTQPSPSATDAAENNGAGGADQTTKPRTLQASSESATSLLPCEPASFLWQFWYLFRRTALVDMRYPRFIFVDTCLQMLPGIALAIPYFGVDQYSPPLPIEVARTCISIIADRCHNQVMNPNHFVASSFFLVMILGAAAQIYSVATFGRNMAVFRRECGAGLNRTAFFLAKCTYDLMNITRCAIIFAAFYFLLNSPRGGFGEWFAVYWTLYFAGFGIGYLISFIVRFDLTTTIAVCLGICFSVTSGLTPKITTVDGWGPLRVVWYLSYSRWSAEAMVILAGAGDTGGRMDAALQQAGYNPDNFALDIGMVIILGLVWRLAAFAIMMRKSKR